MMKHILKLYLLFAFALFFSGVQAQDILINEFQSRNFSFIEDEDGDLSDWVEIKNVSNQTISLLGYGLTDNQANPFKWQFPDVSLAPEEVLLIWLSGKNKNIPGAPLHANFSLSTEEPILVVNPGMVEFDIIEPTPTLRDISYGRSLEGELGYFAEPTPGAPNITELALGIATPPTFSHPSGMYTDQFTVSITGSENATIVYTLDGSEPELNRVDDPMIFQYKNSYPLQPGNPFGEFLFDSLQSSLYTGPILVHDRSEEPDIISQVSSTPQFNPPYLPDQPSFKGMVIRARTYAEGLIPSETTTCTYFVTEEGWERYNHPIASITISRDDFYEYEKGIHTAGRGFDTWRLNNPDAIFVPISKANYSGRGKAWERPVVMEVFDLENQLVPVSMEMGMRIHGASSRRLPRKSFRFYTRNLYGGDEVNYPLMGEGQPTTYERFILRNSGGDEFLTNMRNALTQTIAQPMRMITSPGKPYYTFINSEFYGLNIMQTYFDDNYFNIEYGIADDDLDLVAGNGDLKYGTLDRYNEVADACENFDFSNEESFAQFEEWVELESFIDVWVVNTIAANGDMLPKNTLWWRNKAEDSADDRLKSILVDQDRAWAHKNNGELQFPSYNMISHFLEDTDEVLAPYLACFTNAMNNLEFRNRFINRSADALNSYFTAQRVVDIVEERRELYLPNYDEHIDRWSANNNPQSVEEWNHCVDTIVNFATARPTWHRQHISEFFETDGMYDLVLDVSDPAHGYVHLNTIAINSETEGISEDVYPWEGIYFNNVAVTMTAIPAEGFEFSHWEGAIDGTEVEVSSTFDSDSVYVKAIFIPETNLSVSENAEHSFGVFPNPTDGQITILSQDQVMTEILVYDNLGRLISKEGGVFNSERKLTLPKTRGIYFLEVKFEDNIITREKIVRL